MYTGWKAHELTSSARTGGPGRHPASRRPAFSARPRTPACPAGSPPPTGHRSRGRGRPRTGGPRTRGPDGHPVAAPPQLLDDGRGRAGLDGEAAGPHPARVERAGEAVGVPVRCVDRALEVESPAHGRAPGDLQEEVQLPLVLLVAAGRAERQHRNPVAQGDRGGEGGAGAAAGGEGVRQAVLQPGHLQPGAEREAQFGHDGVGLEPAAAGGGGDQVAPAVDDVDVAGVPRHAPAAGDRGLADAHGAEAGVVVGHHVRVRAQPGRPPAGAAGPQLQRRPGADQGPPPGVVLPRQQLGQRHRRRVAVPGLPVGHGELAALDQQVDVVRAAALGQLARQQRQLLQQRGPLAPGPGLAHGPAVPVVRRRRLVGRGPGGEVVGGERAGVPGAAGVEGGPPGLADQCLGDEPGPPHLPRGLDARLAVPGARGLGEQPAPGGGEGGVAQQLSGPGGPSTGQVQLGGRRPLGLEQLADGLDGGAEVLHGRVAVLGVADGVLQDVVQGAGAVVAQQDHPGVEGARHGGGERPGAGHQVEAQAAVVGDARPGRCDALPAQHPHLAAGGGEQDRHLTGRAVQVRLDDVQHERAGHHGVVGVAAVLQHGHRRLGGQPVRGRDHAVGALERGAGGEHGAVTSLWS